jgi:hypothetical protein
MVGLKQCLAHTGLIQTGGQNHGPVRKAARGQVMGHRLAAGISVVGFWFVWLAVWRAGVAGRLHSVSLSLNLTPCRYLVIPTFNDSLLTRFNWTMSWQMLESGRKTGDQAAWNPQGNRRIPVVARPWQRLSRRALPSARKSGRSGAPISSPASRTNH